MSYDDIIKSSVVAELEAAEAGRDYCDLPDTHPVHRYPIMAREPIESPTRDLNKWLRGH